MTKVKINPGVCGMICTVSAQSDDGETVNVEWQSDCPALKNMLKELGTEFNAYEVCLKKPGAGPLYEYAREHFPVHCACPTVAGIIKCVEAECKLALPRDSSITFEK